MIPTLAELVTFAGASAAVAAVFEIGKRLVKPDPAILDRFGAIAAMALGVAIAGGASLVQGVDPVPAIVVGVLAGLNAVGIYKAAS